MSAVFTLPDLGEGLSEAEVVRWLVAAGDTVAVDEPVVEVETAKSLVELPSPFAGVVGTLHGAEGEVVAVGAPLMTMAGDGDEGDDQGAAALGGHAVQGGVDAAPEPPQPRPTGDGAPLPAPVADAVTEERAGSGNVLIGYGTSAPEVSRGGRRGRRGRPDRAARAVEDLPAAQAPLVSSPLVRALARRHGLDLAAVTGSGEQGLITRSDVEAAVGAQRVSDPPAAADVQPTPAADGAATGEIPPSTPPEPPVARTSVGTDRRTGLPELRRVPVRGVRRAVSEAMVRSRAEIPEATTWVDVDATALLELRAALAPTAPTLPTAPPRGPGLLALVARFVVAGLARFPELNARLDTDTGEVVLLDGVNLGIATQTERGLVVPAVRGAHRLSARGLDAEIRRLTAAARSGRASPAELGGGSFTLNNYGVMGVDGSAAIINHPEVAILGMGRVLPRPWVVDGAVVARSVAQLSLVFDHRVCDGGTAGGFLRFVADAVENPSAALADL